MATIGKVTGSNINHLIGERIRAVRKSRGYTQEELAQLISWYGHHEISAVAVGSWERGTRAISAEHLHQVAHVLKCTEQTLYDEEHTENRLYNEVTKLPQDLQDILLYMLVHWRGDAVALLECNWLYMSITDARLRSDISGMCLTTWEKARAMGLIDAGYEANIEDVERKWGELLK